MAKLFQCQSGRILKHCTLNVLDWIQLFSESFLRLLRQFQDKHQENSEMQLNYTQLRMVLISVLEIEWRRKEGCMPCGKMISFYISLYFFHQMCQEHDFQGLLLFCSCQCHFCQCPQRGN